MSDEDITVDSGGVTLAARYRDMASPVAAAVLISGSGRTDRNSDVRLGLLRLRSGITRAIADALAGVPVCSLRYDKRHGGQL